MLILHDLSSNFFKIKHIDKIGNEKFVIVSPHHEKLNAETAKFAEERI